MCSRSHVSPIISLPHFPHSSTQCKAPLPPRSVLTRRKAKTNPPTIWNKLNNHSFKRSALSLRVYSGGVHKQPHHTHTHTHRLSKSKKKKETLRTTNTFPRVQKNHKRSTASSRVRADKSVNEKLSVNNGRGVWLFRSVCARLREPVFFYVVACGPNLPLALEIKKGVLASSPSHPTQRKRFVFIYILLLAAKDDVLIRLIKYDQLMVLTMQQALFGLCWRVFFFKGKWD